MLKTKMREEELDAALKRHGMALSDACHMIFIYAATPISPSHVRQDFERYGSLSRPATACFRLLFRILDNVRQDGPRPGGAS